MFFEGITAVEDTVASGLKDRTGVEFGINDDSSGFQGLLGTTHRFFQFLILGKMRERERNGEMGMVPKEVMPRVACTSEDQ